MFGLTLVDTVLFVIGAMICLFWLYCYVKGQSQKSLFAALSEEEFPLKELYPVGYAFCELIHMNYTGKKVYHFRKNIEVLYGEKYVDYYMYVLYAQRFAIGLTVLTFAVPLYALSDELIMVGLGVMFAWAGYQYFTNLPGKKIAERSEALLVDFSEMVSKLALLVNAGMILREAWQNVAYAGDGVLYKEMQISVVDMENGISDQEAIYRFGQRCMLLESKKFVSTLVQGMSKGNSELCIALSEQSKELWAAKKQEVRRQGALAANKLLVPLFITFIGILVMVLIPIFANLGI